MIIVTGHGDIDSTITALQYGASDLSTNRSVTRPWPLPLSGRKIKSVSGNSWLPIPRTWKKKWRKHCGDPAQIQFQRLLIHSSHDAIVAFDQDWQIVVYNPEAARIFEKKSQKRAE